MYYIPYYTTFKHIDNGKSFLYLQLIKESLYQHKAQTKIGSINDDKLIKQSTIWGNREANILCAALCAS